MSVTAPRRDASETTARDRPVSRHADPRNKEERPSASGREPAVTNALTIDLEDWAQSTLGPNMPITDRVVRNTDRMLDLLDRHGVRATFFALGKVCEKFPQLLPRIASAGHEIATHGFGHELVYTLDPERFRADVQRGIAVVEAQTGRRPIGYRAPAFSITRDCMWVGPILTELEIRYSSSIFPFAGRRYGIPDASRFSFRWANCDLIEFPLTTIRRWGRNLPVAGGGYLRLLPRAILAKAFQEINDAGQPVVIYLHPYEMDVNELAELKAAGWSIQGKTYLTQSIFRGRVRPRLTALLRAFSFSTMADVLGFD